MKKTTRRVTGWGVSGAFWGGVLFSALGGYRQGRLKLHQWRFLTGNQLPVRSSWQS